MDNQLAIPDSLCTNARCRAALVWEGVTVAGKLILAENDHSVRSPSDSTVVTSSSVSLPLEHDVGLLQFHAVTRMIRSLTSHVLPAMGSLDGLQIVWQDKTGEVVSKDSRHSSVPATACMLCNSRSLVRIDILRWLEIDDQCR